VEALGNNAEEIYTEARRLMDMGLSMDNTVFKIPISLEGTKACKLLTDQGIKVNLHLVYTVHQAYMAFRAGATYVCPLVGRLQDQGHDALGLVKQCVDIAEKYEYESKVMFSSVRHAEHVKNALEIGVHACTIPWRVMRQLTENHFTTIGTNQFIEDTKLLTQKVSDIVKTENVSIPASSTILDAVVLMTKSGLGAVVAINADNSIHRILTDGDLRRLLETETGNIQEITLSSLDSNSPISIPPDANLQAAMHIFRTKHVDNLLVMENGKFIGIIDIQDVIS
jgi:TalC/MipB family fructose-6-phosphate aldolase